MSKLRKNLSNLIVNTMNHLVPNKTQTVAGNPENSSQKSENIIYTKGRFHIKKMKKYDSFYDAKKSVEDQIIANFKSLKSDDLQKKQWNRLKV